MAEHGPSQGNPSDTQSGPEAVRILGQGPTVRKEKQFLWGVHDWQRVFNTDLSVETEEAKFLALARIRILEPQSK